MSDEAILSEQRLNNGRQGSSRGSRGGKGLTQGDQPLGGRASDTEPKGRVDPNNGWAAGGGTNRSSHDVEGGAQCVSSDAGISAGGEEQSSFLPRPPLERYERGRLGNYGARYDLLARYITIEHDDISSPS